MKKSFSEIIAVSLIVVMVTNLNSIFTFAEDVDGQKTIRKEDVKINGDYVKGQVLIKYAGNKDENDIEEAVEDVDGEITQQVELETVNEKIACVEIPNDTPIKEAICELQNDENIIGAQPNYIHKISVNPVNDPGYSAQYHLRYNYAEKGANVDAAWDFIKRNNIKMNSIRLGVLDSGADIDHPDLTNAINKQLSVEVVPDYYSWNYITYPLIGDGDYKMADIEHRPRIPNYHGTHVTGLIAATSNNGIGTTGVASFGNNNYLDTVVVDCMDAGSGGTTFAIIDSLDYAMKIKCRVINMSFGGVQDPFIDQQCQICYDNGITLVAAAGNDGSETYSSPAAYSTNIGVINTNINGQRESSSTYGSWYCISAPGTDITSTFPYPTTTTGRLINDPRNTGYVELTGTSMATPIVSAICAMCLAINPKLTPAQIKNIVTSTARDINTPGFDKETGYGLIDAEACVNKAYSMKYINNTGVAWVEKDGYYNIGIAYDTNDTKPEFRWMQYDLTNQEWKVIADWSNSNWAEWKTQRGDYWLNCEMRTSDKKGTDSKTIAFHYAFDDFGTYAGWTNDGVLLGCNSPIPTSSYYFKIYNLDTRTWQWGSRQFSSWVVWKPNRGNYWTHFEVYSDDGRLIGQKTYCFAV